MASFVHRQPAVDCWPRVSAGWKQKKPLSRSVRKVRESFWSSGVAVCDPSLGRATHHVVSLKTIANIKPRSAASDSAGFSGRPAKTPATKYFSLANIYAEE
jgi:hypothetical protein